MYAFFLLEYAYGGRLTDKADVYSYGIVVLEMLTERRPTANVFVDGKSLVAWVRSSVPGNFMDVVGRLLRDEIHGSAVQQDAILRVLMLALACTRNSPRDRPAMSVVLDALLLIKQRGSL